MKITGIGSIILMVCLLFTMFAVTVSAEEVKPTYFADKNCAYDYISQDVAFAGEYEAVKEEYNVWLFTDEQNEEMVLVTEAGLNKEEISFRYRGTPRVGLPDNAVAIDWTFFSEGRWMDTVLENIGNVPSDAREKMNAEMYAEWLALYESAEAFVRNKMSQEAAANIAYLTSPYYLLGGWYDLNGDGIYQEAGIDYDGDLKGDVFAAGIGILGDVNGDGLVNLKDVLTLRKVLVNMGVSAYVPLAADIDGDGNVTMKDLLVLRKWF